MKKEIWKNIKNYEGLYQVSNIGRIKSFKRNESIMQPNDNGKGYLQVGLSKNGKRSYFKIHRLVAEAFIPNPYSKPEVNHIDGNKQNNTVENLEWCTTKENCQHRQKTGLGNIEAATKAKYKIVLKYDLKTGKILEEFESAKAAALSLGSNRSDNIARVCRGERNSFKGFGFKYK